MQLNEEHPIRLDDDKSIALYVLATMRALSGIGVGKATLAEEIASRQFIHIQSLVHEITIGERDCRNECGEPMLL